MIELELLGVGADGNSIVFTDIDGHRYSAPITDELRGAARRDRPHVKLIPESHESGLKPKQIQTLLRSGLTAEEIAHEYNANVEHVRRYEAPVDAEKEWALSVAQNLRIGDEIDSPILSEIVVNRLAARGVDPRSLAWSAQRLQDQPWEICLTFIQGAAEHAAHWQLSSPSPSAVLTAIDQEAQWLTETVSSAPVTPIFTPLHKAPIPEPLPEPSDPSASDQLLDQLNAARGKRVELDFPLDDGEDAESFSDALDAQEKFEPPVKTPAAKPSRPLGSISAKIHSLTQIKAGSKTPQLPPHMTTDRAAEKNSAETNAVTTAPAETSENSRKNGETGEYSRVTWSGRVGKIIHASAEDESPGGENNGTPVGGESEHTSQEGTLHLPTRHNLEEESDSSTDSSSDLLDISSAHLPHQNKRSKRRSVPSWDEIVFGGGRSS